MLQVFFYKAFNKILTRKKLLLDCLYICLQLIRNMLFK
jgi:hypothetical protein